MRQAWVIAAAMALAFASEGSARADAAGDAVLAGMDQALNRARTLEIDYEITNKEPARAERTLGMGVKQKGPKQLSEFTAPADMKGTKVLVLSPTQMYVYLPAFGKVRRIASHVVDQGFMGLSFSQNDLAPTSFASSYTAQVASQTATEWVLVATPKPGTQTPYVKIQITVAKSNSLPSELRYYDAQNQNIKTETRTGYTCEGNVCTPGERKMTDNVHGAWTKLVAKSRRVNQEISDDVFSQRNLGE